MKIILNSQFSLRAAWLCSYLPQSLMLGSAQVPSRIARIFQGLLLGSLLMLSACVYEVDVQQGNKLEPKDVARIEVGMTRNQVRFLLGTPVISDVFHDDRWDYLYYFRAGRSNKPERRWIIVWFDGNIVREVQLDVETRPS